jgi:hypothetical protein
LRFVSNFGFPISSFTLILLSVGGCATHVIPPAHPQQPVTVYLSDYGRHSSIFLPGAEGHFFEYAFGDWDFFARGHTGWWIGLRALLHSPQATLGRRELIMPPDVREDEIKSKLECKRVMRLTVSRARADALLMDLDNRFRRAAPQPLYSSYSQLYHVRDDEHYWGLHNCNHVTANWLRRLGCEIRGTAITSQFYVADGSPQRRCEHGEDL